MLDFIFISPSNASTTYQSLSTEYAAIEPPTWVLLLAESCRTKGHQVAVLDCLAEQLTDDDALKRIEALAPSIICFVVYGQNVNAGTTNMGGATRLSKYLKASGISIPIGFIGSHVQALPKETLELENSIDFVFLNEGVYSLHEIFDKKAFDLKKLTNVTGLAVKTEGRIVFTGAPRIVAQENIDEIMPGYAWDLLPFRDKPLDLYRSPYWHAQYKSQLRSPYAAIQTSVGCRFKCGFCMINLINKNDTATVSEASNYSGMRHWSTEFVLREMTRLIGLGVKTIRITDEMFLLNKKYYLPIIDMLVNLNSRDDLYLWAYSRIDTVPSPAVLDKLRTAGFRWLCLGIESGNKSIRLEVAKGKFEDVDVETVVRQVEAAGIHVMANYIFGLPGETEETIEETYKLSVKLNTLGWNTYAAMALPGSPIYTQARSRGEKLPQSYEQFSFHSYETIPLSTDSLDASRILELRDTKFTEYFSRPEFHKKIVENFGEEASINIKEMIKHKLKRRIIDERDTTVRSKNNL
jgi:radical SAM superfamily enzyme YgiQ (UPF0313 family)